MGERLKENYIAQITDVDSTGRMNIFSMAQYVQIISTHHAAELNMGYYQLGEAPKYYWVVSRIKYKMKQYPKWQDEFGLRTFSGGYDKLFGVRICEISNRDGQEIGQVIIDYILLDANKHRPINIKNVVASDMNVPYEGEKLGKIPLPKEIFKEDIRTAYYSELDVNQHMNNAMYIRWILDIISLEQLNEAKITSLQINYNASIVYRDKVRVVLGKSEKGALLVGGTSLDGKINYFTSEVILETIESEE